MRTFPKVCSEALRLKKGRLFYGRKNGLDFRSPYMEIIWRVSYNS